MTDQSAPGRRRGNPSWTKGGPSPNPHGRPRVGAALAEKIRERLDPDAVIDLAFQVANDSSLPSERRLAALYGLADRGFTKPATDTNLTVSGSGESAAGSWENVPIDVRRAELERMRALRAGHSSDAEATGDVPARTDEEPLR